MTSEQIPQEAGLCMGFDSYNRKGLSVPRVRMEGGRDGRREAKETENRIRSSKRKKTQRLAPPTYSKLASRQTRHKMMMVDMNENRIHTGFWLKRRC